MAGVVPGDAGRAAGRGVTLRRFRLMPGAVCPFCMGALLKLHCDSEYCPWLRCPKASCGYTMTRDLRCAEPPMASA